MVWVRRIDCRRRYGISWNHAELGDPTEDCMIFLRLEVCSHYIPGRTNLKIETKETGGGRRRIYV